MRWIGAMALGVSLVLAGAPAHADKIDEAQAAFAEFDDDGALKLLDQAVEEAKGDPHELALAYFNRGEVRASTGDYEPAVADFTAALALPLDENERAQTLISRAEQYNRHGRPEDALNDYDASLALVPEQLGVHTARAQVRQKLGDTDGALADFEAELKLHPTYYRALVGRALITGGPLPPDPTKGRR